MISDIFISYASEDRKRVQSLAQALERKGWSVWWDRRIPIGQFFDEVIEEALDAAKAVVVVWTDTSVKSQWVKREAREGLRRRVLFPVMFVEETKIPLEFRDVQTAYLMDWQPDQEHPGFDQFVNDIARQIGIPMNSLIQPPPIPLSQDGSSLPTHQPGETSLSATTPAQVEPVRAIIGGNSTLMSLSVSPGTLTPAFSADTVCYTVNVASTLTSITVSATKGDKNAVMSGDLSALSGVGTGQATIQLQGPGATTNVTIWVAAPGGSQRSYRVNVDRAALSGNNNLLAFKVSPGILTPAFSTETIGYTVNVASSAASITVTPTAQDLNAMITLNGSSVTSGQGRSITLNGTGSDTLVNLVVAAQNGAQKTYSVKVKRAALSGNNNLSAVNISPGSLTPSFAAAITSYTVNVDSHVSSINMTATLQDTNARMTINGEETNSGQTRFISLNGHGSSTKIDVIVIAPNGASKTYFITLNRAALSQTAEAETRPDRLKQQSANPARLSGVTGSAPSTESLPYLPIGVGLLAALGALIHFVILQPDPFTYTWGELLSRPTVESPIVKRTGKDGSTMVLVPAGEFMMGWGRDGDPYDETNNSQQNNQPAHPVYLDAFYIDQYETTNSRYATFLQENNREAPKGWSEEILNQDGGKPVVGVDWEDAVAYCSLAGKRLPTEAEWEKAARGTDQRFYPWGNAKPGRAMSNIFTHEGIFIENGLLTDVGALKLDKSPYGVYDMGGNAKEWVADWYDHYYYRHSQSRNPKGPSSGRGHVIRGGSIRTHTASSLSRGEHAPTARERDLGFRCAQDIES